jgi:glycosyltransferase involved in cell wall biosynthesis
LKLTVITVTYNCASVVSECIASVAAQTHVDTEHLVIDGESTDSTVAVLLDNLKHLTVLVSEADEGIYDAMNKGIKRAQGDVIGFLNSDDVYTNNIVLSKVASLFAADSLLDVCYADLVYTDKANLARTRRYWKSCEFVTGMFSKGWCPPHPTLFVRRSVYERFGVFNLSYGIAADVELMMRLFEVHAVRACYVPEVWVKMRLGGTTNRNVKNIYRQNQEVLRALRSHGLSAKPIYFFCNKLILRGKQFFRRPVV